MSIKNLKRILLAGTALVAVAVLVPHMAFAADEIKVDTDASAVFDADELANSAFDWGANTNGTAASAEATNAKNVSVLLDATISGFTAAGDSTIGSGTGNAITAGANAKTLTLSDSINGDNVSTITIGGAISIGAFTAFNLTLAGNTSDATGDAGIFDINGSVNLGTGTLTVDSDTNAGNTVGVKISGDVTAAAIVLKDDGAPIALTFDGLTTAQAVTATLNGETDADGIVVINNAAGVTFTGAIGSVMAMDSITVAGTAVNSKATFKAATKATAIVLGDGLNTDTNTVTFDGTTASFSVTGTVNGTAGDTDNVVISGGTGKTITLVGVWGGAGGGSLSSISIDANTGLTTGGAVTATTITVGAGALLTTAGGLVTAAVNISGAAGAVTLGDGLDITGALDNTSGTAAVGVLNVGDAAGGSASVISGLVGATNSLSAINLTGAGNAQFSEVVKAATITASVDAGSLDFAKAVTGTINMSADAVVTLADDADITGTVNNTNGATGKGTLNSTTNAATNTISGAVGGTTVAQRLKAVILTGAGAFTGTTAFGSTVNALDITFAGGAATATFANDVTLTNNIDFVDFDGVATFADGADFTGNIDDTQDGKGTVNFTGSSVVTGSLGSAAGNSLAAVNFNGIAGKTVTVSAASDATLFTVAGAGSVSFAEAVTGNLAFGVAAATATIADGKSFTGAMNGTGGLITAGIGNVVFAGSTTGVTTVGNTGFLKSITINDGAVQKTVTTGAFIAPDTTTLNDNVLAVTGAYTLGAAQTLKSTITGTTTALYGNVTSTGVATVATTSLVNLTNSSTLYIPTATNFTIVDGTGGAAVGVLAAGKLTVNGVNSGAGVTVTNGLMTYSQAVDTANLVITATRAATATASGTTNGGTVGAVLDSATFGAASTGNILLIQANMQNATTAAALNEVLEAASPTVDGSASAASLDVGAQVQGIADTRIASLRSGDVLGGVAAGAAANGWSMWVQGYGQHAEQDLKDGIDGYDADTLGGTIGFDSTNMVSNGVLGLAFNYGHTNADSDNANTTDTDVDNYGVNLYGSYDVGQDAFVNGQIGYAYNKIDMTRHNVGGIAGVTAEGDTDSSQYSAKVALGRDYAADNGLTLTPSVSAGYTHLRTDGYTETGAGGANLVVSSSTLNVVKLGVGGTAVWNLRNSDGSTMKPALRVGYTYDATADRVETSSTFNGVGAAFKTEGPRPDRHQLNAGAGLTYMTTANWDLSANYDYTYKAHYDAHTGVLRATSHF